MQRFKPQTHNRSPSLILWLALKKTYHFIKFEIEGTTGRWIAAARAAETQVARSTQADPGGSLVALTQQLSSPPVGQWFGSAQL